MTPEDNLNAWQEPWLTFLREDWDIGMMPPVGFMNTPETPVLMWGNAEVYSLAENLVDQTVVDRPVVIDDSDVVDLTFDTDTVIDLTFNPVEFPLQYKMSTWMLEIYARQYKAVKNSLRIQSIKEMELVELCFMSASGMFLETAVTDEIVNHFERLVYLTRLMRLKLEMLPKRLFSTVHRYESKFYTTNARNSFRRVLAGYWEQMAMANNIVTNPNIVEFINNYNGLISQYVGTDDWFYQSLSDSDMVDIN